MVFCVLYVSASLLPPSCVLNASLCFAHLLRTRNIVESYLQLNKKSQM